MNVDGIMDGIVMDHIKAGMSMEIYRLLELDELDCCVAILKNVSSRKYGKKDIIKIATEIDLDLDILGYIDPHITVNVVRDGKLTEKKHVALPNELKNVLVCKNPRCITTIEQEIDQVFHLADEKNGIYRCMYCESKAKGAD